MSEQLSWTGTSMQIEDKLSQDLEDMVDVLQKKALGAPSSARGQLSMDLENMLEMLDRKVEAVVSQITQVRKTREELLSVSKVLQENLKVYNRDPDIDEEHEKRLQTVSSDIKRRAEMVKTLEKRELLLSHSILASINSWVKELTTDSETRSDQWEGTQIQEDLLKVTQPASEELLECPLTKRKDTFTCKRPENEDELPGPGEPEVVCKVNRRRTSSPPMSSLANS